MSYIDSQLSSVYPDLKMAFKQKPIPKTEDKDTQKESSPIRIVDVTDQPKKTVAQNTPETVRIELDHIVEHMGRYYRGVLEVSPELAKILVDLDKSISAKLEEK